MTLLKKLNQPLAFNWRQNSFNFLRILLASSVIIAHSFELGGFGYDPLFYFSNNIYSVGAVAVDGFFAISGALIAASYMNINSVNHFLWHRFLRIFPGFWGCIIVCGLLIPIIFGLPPNVKYAVSNTLFPTLSVAQSAIGFFLPLFFGWSPDLGLIAQKLPFFGQNSLPGIMNNENINGSLWTLAREFNLYCLIAVLGVTRQLNVRVVGAIFIINWFLYSKSLIHDPSFSGLAKASSYRTTAHFLAGTLFYFWLPAFKHWIALVFFLLSLLFLKIGLYPIIAPIATVYLVMYLAAALPFYQFGKTNDLSYGLYIYSYPIQKTLSSLGFNVYGLVSYGLLSIVLSTVFAACSWLFIERNALKLKHAFVRDSKNDSIFGRL